ncbi:MAG: flavodoxin family protein [Candidatus Izemoplasmataceae bacterium]
MSSKSIWINGSPNLNGFTMGVAKEVLKSYDIKRYDSYQVNVNSCDDCKVCHYKLGCKFNDDHTKIIEDLKIANTLILTTPIYFGAMTDQLLKIINRFQSLFERKFTHNTHDIAIDNLIVISTCASDDTSMFDGLKLTIRILEKLFSVKNTFTLLLGNTDQVNPLNTEESTIKSFQETIKKALH